MQSNIKLLERGLALLSAIWLVSCAQLPSHVSMTSKAVVQGSSATFQRCALSVRFTSNPRVISQQEAALFTSSLTKFSRWEIEGLAYVEYRLAEYAVCLCRDYDFSASEIAQAETSLRNSADIKLVETVDLPYSKKTIDFESASKTSGIGERMRFLYPTNAPACIFVQAVNFGETTSITPQTFFSTAQPSSVGPVEGFGASSPTKPTPAADRLETLRELRRRDLITPQEYEQRRKAILNDL